MRGRALGWAAALTLVGCSNEASFHLNTHTDTWQQAPNNEVDILFVVDDSCSMAEEQDTLARGFETFVGQMEDSGTDFHIGVISTSFEYDDPQRGVLRGAPPFLTAADDYVSAFQARAQMGTDGSDKEKGLEAATWALSPAMTTGANRGFLRPKAHLLVVVVSDEEDCSDEGRLEGQPAESCYTEREKLVPVSEYVVALQALKPRRELVQVGAIIGVEGAACQAYPSQRYLQAATLTGGLVGDICSPDWSGMLTDLGLNASGVRDRFQLSYGAVEDSIVVTVDGEEVVEDPILGWQYDAGTWFIHFAPSAIPPRGSEIAATYTIDPGAPEPEAP